MNPEDMTHSYARSAFEYSQGGESSSNGFNNAAKQQFKTLLNSKESAFEKLHSEDSKLEIALNNIVPYDENKKELGIYKINNDKIANIDKWNDTQDLSISYFQFLKIISPHEHQTQKVTETKDLEAIKNRIVSRLESLKKHRSLLIHEYKNHPLSIILEGWIKRITEITFDKKDAFTKCILENLERCIGFYEIAFKKMYEGYTKESVVIDPLLYRHCARLYEFAGDLIFVLLAHEYDNKTITLQRYQEIMGKKDIDSILGNHREKLKITDYPATSGCDAFLKTLIVLDKEKNNIPDTKDNLYQGMTKVIYEELKGYTALKIAEKHKIFFMNFSANKPDTAIAEVLFTNKEILQTIENYNKNYKRDTQKAVVVVDTTLKDSDDSFVKQSMEALYKCVEEGSLIIIEPKSFQKFAQLGNGKLKLGNIRVIEKESDDSFKALHDTLTTFAKETLVGSKEEVDMMLFMTEANPKSEDIFVKKVKENVDKFTDNDNEKKRAFFIDFTPERQSRANDLFPANFTFGFTCTTGNGRTSVGLEPYALINHYVKELSEPPVQKEETEADSLRERIDYFRNQAEVGKKYKKDLDESSKRIREAQEKYKEGFISLEEYRSIYEKEVKVQRDAIDRASLNQVKGLGM